MKIVMRFRRRFWPEDMYFCTPTLFGRSSGTRAGDAVARRICSRPLSVARGRTSCVSLKWTWWNLLGELDRIFGERIASQNYEDAYLADWTREPFVRGLYSFPLAQTEPRHREALAASLGGKLFLPARRRILRGIAGRCTERSRAGGARPTR